MIDKIKILEAVDKFLIFMMSHFQFLSNATTILCKEVSKYGKFFNLTVVTRYLEDIIDTYTLTFLII